MIAALPYPPSDPGRWTRAHAHGDAGRMLAFLAMDDNPELLIHGVKNRCCRSPISAQRWTLSRGRTAHVFRDGSFFLTERHRALPWIFSAQDQISPSLLESVQPRLPAWEGRVALSCKDVGRGLPVAHWSGIVAHPKPIPPSIGRALSDLIALAAEPFTTRLSNDAFCAHLYGGHLDVAPVLHMAPILNTSMRPWCRALMEALWAGKLPGVPRHRLMGAHAAPNHEKSHKPALICGLRFSAAPPSAHARFEATVMARLLGIPTDASSL